MNVRIHPAEQIPEINTLCLVLYEDRDCPPDLCWYLDDTDIEVEQCGGETGFYVCSEPRCEGPVTYPKIRGWIDMDEIDREMQDTAEPMDCPLCHNRLREYVGMDGDWICKTCNCMSGDPELWEVLQDKCEQLRFAISMIVCLMNNNKEGKK